MYKIPIVRLNNLYTIIKAKYLKFLYNKFKNKLLFIKNRMTKYYNIKKIKRLSFKKKTKYIYYIKIILQKKNKIYLFRKNIIIKRPNNKLNFKKFRFFIIIYKILKYNYKLL